MICSKCGRKLADNLKFCTECGGKAIGSPPIQDMTKTDSGSYLNGATTPGNEINTNSKKPSYTRIYKETATVQKKQIRLVPVFAIIFIIALIGAGIKFIPEILDMDDKTLTGKSNSKKSGSISANSLNEGQEGNLINVDGVILTNDDSPENRIIAESETINSWEDFKDTDKERKRIDIKISELKKALEKNDIQKAVSYFSEPTGKDIEAILSKNKENVDILLDILSNTEMIYLSPPVDSDETDFYRMAEYNAVFNKDEYVIVFIEVNGEWVIDSL